jgi:hypothetical protein
MNLHDPEIIADGADKIANAILSESPFFVGRNGSTEMEAAIFWSKYMNTSAKREVSRVLPPNTLRNIFRGVGIWPATVEAANAWLKEYVEGLETLDVVAAGWYEPYRAQEDILLNTYAPDAYRIPLRSLEPYYMDPCNRWTQYLAGKRVAVVSSFCETIRKQIGKDGIWERRETVLPPTTTWIPIRSYFPPDVSMGDATGWPPSVKSWDDAVTMMVNAVVDSGATIALIGCGGLGMILGARLKRLGISSVIMGGAIQVLFGIKGLRWESHSIISKLWNDAWVWPDASETPSGSIKIEGGCYWGKGDVSGARPSTTPR